MMAIHIFRTLLLSSTNFTTHLNYFSHKTAECENILVNIILNI